MPSVIVFYKTNVSFIILQIFLFEKVFLKFFSKKLRRSENLLETAQFYAVKVKVMSPFKSVDTS